MASPIWERKLQTYFNRPVIWLLLLSIVLGGCGGSTAPAELLLKPADVPLEYRVSDLADDELDAPLYDGCLVANRLERVEDAQPARVVFDHEETGYGIAQWVVVTSEAKQLLGDIRKLMADCEESVMAGGNYTATTHVRPAEGPDVGDEAFWFSSRMDFNTATSGQTAGTPNAHLIFRTGDALVHLSGPVALSYEEGRDFLVELANTVLAKAE